MAFSSTPNNFMLSEAEDNTSGPLNRWDIADLPLLRKLLAICQVPRDKFLGSDGLCFSRICKFCSFKNPFATITSLSELYFRFRRFVLLVQMKKVISVKSKNHGDEWEWTWYLQWWIYTSIPTWTYSLATAEAPMEHLSNDHKDHPNQHENSHKLCSEMGNPVVNLMESQRKLRQ